MLLLPPPQKLMVLDVVFTEYVIWKIMKLVWPLVNDIHTKFDEIGVLIQEYLKGKRGHRQLAFHKQTFSLRKGMKAKSNILKPYKYQHYYCMNCTDFDNSFVFLRNQFSTYALVHKMCTCISSIIVLWVE